MPKAGDKVICLEDESLATVVSLTAGGSPDIVFSDGSRGTYLLHEFAELFGYATPPAAQPAPVQPVLKPLSKKWKWVLHESFADVAGFDEEGIPSFYWKESVNKFKSGELSAPCKGKNCGSLNGWLHSSECRAEHEAQYTTPPAAPMTEFEEAVAAVDNTLHHAIDHWQGKASEQAVLLRECRFAIDTLIEKKPAFAMLLCGSTTLGNLRASLHDYRVKGKLDDTPPAAQQIDEAYAVGYSNGMTEGCEAGKSYAAAQRQWVGLTDEDKHLIELSAGITEDDDGYIVSQMFKLTEAKLKERNT
jgi:hypothetical protein